jgi:catechol 2,3-dioxygenase-like lactoylglutathione lyase family enzyme
MKTLPKFLLAAVVPLASAAAPLSPQKQISTTSGFELGAVTILVRNEDEAAAWYERNLGLEMAVNTRAPSGERFVALKASAGPAPLIVLHRPRTTDIEADRRLPFRRIGQETYWVWHTSNFDASYKRLQDNHVKFIGAPRSQFYGREAVFEDLYGNLFILQQPNGQFHFSS